jgi:hypothetical protein
MSCDPTGLAPLELAEHQAFQLLVLIKEITIGLEDPTPAINLRLIQQYQTILKQIKSSFVVMGSQPLSTDFTPHHTTTHHDWIKSDLSTLLVSSAAQSVQQMLSDLDTSLNDR